ncbi:AbrB family transcriptional regulator [Halostagnicola sp. A56]|uniref:AbrB/MazE/SpoVT family DNA-binding domain-containing protein n=1 Tax=Halostagnicola sp. A56 TaxID=1495067 RepID=UPI0004A0703E|nr:AbrB/MazE/SpoVT family DNA-binding domain-containing protein [Halostagnicola sp. A56]KDE56768.1 AbrB family transcriptional regulator [Halostagnicola sp. A56]KDE59416.1 AbrB family transcriptional regulator [Halostagnicola sp. A56]
MSDTDTRRVGERGQVTLPKDLRESFGIDGGDEVEIREESGKIVIEKPVSRDELAEGYRRRAEQARELTNEMEGTSHEANAYLGDAPEWE